MGAGRAEFGLSVTHELVDVRIRDTCTYTARIFGRGIGIDSGNVYPWGIDIFLCDHSVGISERGILDAVVHQVIISCQRKIITVFGIFSGEREVVTGFRLQIRVTINHHGVCHIEVHVHLFQGGRTEPLRIRAPQRAVSYLVHQSQMR